MSCFLGIDAGTSGIKAVIVDEKGKVLGFGLAECEVFTPRPSWAEANPEDWWTACCQAVKMAVSKSGKGKEVKGIGFSGQMQGCTLMDKDMKSINNCLIWLDQRAASIADSLNSRVDDEILNITSNYCKPSFWAPKLLWIKKHNPKDFEKIKTVLFPKDYLRYRITGEVATDVSDASLSWFLDAKKRTWSDRMFEFTGLSRSLVPERVLESCDIAGYLKKDIAEDWGLTAGIPVATGGGDQTAGGVGCGILKSGTIATTLGTSGVVFGACDTPFIDSQNNGMFSQCHCVPGKYSFLGCTLAAGGSMKWLRDTFFKDKMEELKIKGGNIYEYIDSLAREQPIGTEGLVFLPYMSGSGTPHTDGDARGVFFGLSYRNNLGSFSRAIMEGVTYSLRDTVEIIRESNGIKVDKVIAMGGGSNSQLWRQMQADIYNATVVTTSIVEGPAAGAAIMGAVASKYFNNVEEACSSWVHPIESIDPIQENVKIYNEYYQTYKDLYPALEKLYASQAEKVRNIVK
jgi:xylulokinase